MVIQKLTQKQELERKLSADKRKVEKKKKYLAEWEGMFQKMKAFKKEFSKSTVPKDYSDQRLYRWYRQQKNIYNHPTQKMPKEHLDKLNSINFYFGDGHKEREEKFADKWIALLKEALDNGEKVYTNHRYKYKGKGLGTFLVGVKQDNKKGKKLEVRKKIEALGFELDAMSRSVVTTSLRFLRDLETRKELKKIDFQNRFNHHIMPKANEIPEPIRDNINIAWKERFGDERTWHKIRKFKSPEDFINDFVKKMMSTEEPDYLYFLARFKHSILRRKDMFNAEHRQSLVNAWETCFSEKLDWDMKIRRVDAESIAIYFAEDIENDNYKYGKKRLWARFVKSIYHKRDVISSKTVKRINNAWKKRYGEELDWNLSVSKPNPRDVANKFIDELIMDDNANIAQYKSKIADLVPFRRHWTKEIIQKIETVWQLRFNEKLIWFPLNDNSIEGRIKQWKRYRYDEKKNPKAQWITGPKSMGKLYTWVNRLKKNKYALAPVLLHFTEEEAKEMKRQGFRVDFKLIKKAQELEL